MLSYLFPFSTCESPSTSGSQPFSATINGISTILLLGAATYAHSIPVKCALLSYALVEAIHTWSHIQHISGQQKIIHACVLLMAATTLWMTQSLAGFPQIPMYFWAILMTLVCIDTLALWNRWHGDFVAILSGLSIFVWVVIGRWSVYPPIVKQMLIWLLLGTIVIVALFINELFNCHAMLEAKELPYHAIIELIGLGLFAGTALMWLWWEEICSTNVNE